MRLLPFIVYLDTYVRSPAGQRLLAGLPLETVAVPKALCATPEEVSAQRVARDDEIMPEGETSSPTLIVRWMALAVQNTDSAHPLVKPEIVGLLLPRKRGEEAAYLPWGPAAIDALRALETP